MASPFDYAQQTRAFVVTDVMPNNLDQLAAAYRTLAQAPSRLLAATLEDAAGMELRPNLPGTTRQQNWSLPLPVPLEDLLTAPEPAALARILNQACRGLPQPPARRPSPTGPPAGADYGEGMGAGRTGNER